MSNGNRPNTRTSSVEIADAIGNAILSQQYKPGDRLKEQQIADKFGVSRGPVREAFRLLEARTLLIVEPLRGASVISMSDDEAIEAIEISSVLFGLAARHAAERATKKEISTLYKGVIRLEQLAVTDISPKAFFYESIQLGAIVTQAARSPRLRALIRDVRAGAPTIFGPFGFLTKHLRQRAAANWRSIYEAIDMGNGHQAEQISVRLYDEANEAAKAASNL